MRNYFFSIGLIDHRLWGHVLIAQLLEKEESLPYFISGEILLRVESSLSYQRLTPMQKEVVNIIDEYNDKRLHRLFSKKKTVKEFQDTVDDKLIAEHIRPYIEQRLYRVLRIAAENNFRLFFKENTRQNIFQDDFLEISRKTVLPHFHFRRTGDGTQYRLALLRESGRVGLIDKPALVICDRPAVLLLEKDFLFIEHIEAKKLVPFFTKDYIHVPGSSEIKYYSTFVAATIRDQDAVETTGFSVDDILPEKSATLSLEIGIHQDPVWIVTLHYNNFSIHPGALQRRFVKFSEQNGLFHFQRFSRDEDWEENLTIALEEAGLKSREGTVYTLSKWSGKSAEEKVFEAVKFINDNFRFLVESGFEFTQKLDRKYFLERVELEIESFEKEDWFDLLVKVHFGEYTLPFMKLKNHILNGERLYLLPDGTFAVIPGEWFVRYKPLFEFGKAEEERLRIHKQHFSQVDDALRSRHLSTIDHLEKLNRPDHLPEIHPPRGITAALRAYQLEGFAWMWFLQENGFGGCLADDMGLGKTLQAITVLQLNKELHARLTHEDTPDPGQLSLFSSLSKAAPLTSLVVVPASLIQNWEIEIRRFAPSLKTLNHSGINRKKNNREFSFYDVIISSYHTVRQDIDFMREFNFHYVILDESQMIKNPHSKLYRAMIELQASHKLVLTGTPIENSLTDLWSQVNFVNEGLLGSLNFFKRQFVKTIEKKKDKDQEQRLKELINPFVLRRTKEEVARELPPLYEQVRFCDMTDEQRRHYEEEKSLIRNRILENLEDIAFEKSTMLVLKALTKLRQLSNHPLMIEDEYEGGSGKYDEVFRNIESVVSENHKVLLFSSFVKHLRIYSGELDKMGWKYAMLTGSTRNRQEQVNNFQQDPECRIFLISLKAGGVGLNLTAADYVFILDPWWNPAAEMQALNRAHRIGQDKNVFVYRFISNNTVEEKIQRLQEKKSELAKTFVTSNNPLRNMKKDEILGLFS